MSEILDSVLTTFAQRPKTAVMLSGRGTNAAGLLSNEAVRSLYDVRLLFSDNNRSGAKSLAETFGLDYTVDHVDRISGREHRQAYFDGVLSRFHKLGVSAVLYAGFMKITPENFCIEMPGVNVHPADLTIRGEDGIATYRGMDALPMMRRELGYVASSLHVIDVPVDSGSVIAVTSAVECPPELTDKECHTALKAHERSMYPQGLILLGEGALAEADLPIRINTYE